MKHKCKLKQLSEGDVFLTKLGNKMVYLRFLGNDRHLLNSLEKGKKFEVPHGRYPVEKIINQ